MYKSDFSKTLKNLYYLQQMGIDVWTMRDIKRKVLILIASDDSHQELSESARNLLENMLASTSIKRVDFELLYVNASFDIKNIDLKLYKLLLVMGEDILIGKLIAKNKLPLIQILHPNYLLINPIDKRKAHLSLCELEKNYV